MVELNDHQQEEMAGGKFPTQIFVSLGLIRIAIDPLSHEPKYETLFKLWTRKRS